jgi:hypothetical protein
MFLRRGLLNKSADYLSNEMNRIIDNEFQVRYSIDSKIFSSIGAIIALLTLVIANIDIPIVYNTLCIYEIIVKYILPFAGFVLIVISIINLFNAVLPKKYDKLDFSEIVRVDASKLKHESLVIACNEKKVTIINEYHEVNTKKSEQFRKGILYSIIGFSMIIVFNLILSKIF